VQLDELAETGLACTLRVRDAPEATGHSRGWPSYGTRG